MVQDKTKVATICEFYVNTLYVCDICCRPYIYENPFGRSKSLGKSFYEMRTVSSRLCTCRLLAPTSSLAIPPPAWDKVSVNVGEKRRIPRILWTLGLLMISQGVAAEFFRSEASLFAFVDALYFLKKNIAISDVEKYILWIIIMRRKLAYIFYLSNINMKDKFEMKIVL